MVMSAEYRAAMEASKEGRPESDGDFEELADGFYLATCEKVEERPASSKTGFPQTRFQWRIAKPKSYRRRVQSDFVSMSPNAAWRMRELFDACELTYDSEPEEVKGETVIFEIEQREQEKGKRQGEMVANVIAYYLATDPTYLALVGD